MWGNIRASLNIVTCYSVKGQVWNVSINKTETGLMVKLRLVKKTLQLVVEVKGKKARVTTTGEI